MSRKCRRVSTRIPSVTPWPLRLVPPDRNVIGTPWAAETANSRPTSAASTGVATTLGVRAKCEASWPSANRSVARLRTCPGPLKAAPNAASKPAGVSGSVVLT